MDHIHEVEQSEEAFKLTSVNLIDCLASFSRRKAVPHGQLSRCRCSWLGLFRVYCPLVHLCGSEHTAFPEIGIRNALAALPAHVLLGLHVPELRMVLCMVRYPGETQQTSVPGRATKGITKSCSPSRLWNRKQAHSCRTGQMNRC